MPYTDEDITTALSGVFQSAFLVQELALHGVCDETSFQALMASLFKIDAENVFDVFSGQGNVLCGLQRIVEQLSEGSARNIEQTKYVIAMLHLEKKMAKDPKMISKIKAGIEKAQQQATLFSMTHQNVIASLADIYVETISTLSPKIMVSGDQRYLSNPSIANRIRALLLAGIRATLLWRQCGGSKFQFIISPGKIGRSAQQIIDKIKTEPLEEQI